MEIISGYLTQILTAFFLAFFAWLGVQAKKLYNKYVTTEIKQSVCRTVVRFVEQVYIDLHGDEKLHFKSPRAGDLLRPFPLIRRRLQALFLYPKLPAGRKAAAGWDATP